MDSNIFKLADTLVNYSTHIQPNERVLIDVTGEDAYPLVEAIIEEVYHAGGFPYLHISNPTLSRALLLGATESQLQFDADILLQQMKGMDAYIGINATANISELSDVPSDKKILKNNIYKDVLDERVNRSKWVILRYPNSAMAQLSNTSLRSFEKFYFDVCTMDYAKLDKAMNALIAILKNTDEVRITGPGTDLSFSIKGIPAVKCSGECNIPDGEVYTAPVKDSVNGVITYNTPTIYQGITFENISLTFENGKITHATANHSIELNRILDIDKGSRYIGEFGIGLNPFITKPMKDILFDEKITGSIHFTPGASYEDAPNGNHSNIHWDMVLIQTEAFGGGEIYFDNTLIRKNGLFVTEELKPLNPDAFK